jgi:hypothetical protein
MLLTVERSSGFLLFQVRRAIDWPATEGALFISAAVAKNGPRPQQTNMHRIAQ